MQDETEQKSSWGHYLIYLVAAIAFSFFFKIIHFEGTTMWLVLKDRPVFELPYVSFPGTAEARAMANAQLADTKQAEQARINLAQNMESAIQRSCSDFDRIIFQIGDADLDRINRSGCDVMMRAAFGSILALAPSAPDAGDDKSPVAQPGNIQPDTNQSPAPSQDNQPGFRYVSPSHVGSLVFSENTNGTFNAEIRTVSMKSVAQCEVDLRGVPLQQTSKTPPRYLASWNNDEATCQVQIALEEGVANVGVGGSGCNRYCENGAEFTGRYERAPSPPRQ